MLGPCFAAHTSFRPPLQPTAVASALAAPSCGRASSRSMLAAPMHSSASGSRAWQQEPQQRDGQPAAARRRQRAKRQGEEEEQGGDERGWWEVPEQCSMQAFAVEPLEQWQSERLEQAYAMEGRRKMKVQAMADELGLDRGRVLAWIKEFSSLPAGERDAILAKQRVQVGKERSTRVEQEERQLEDERRAAAAAAAPRAQQQSRAPEPPTGFIPFYTRKEMGLLDGRNKRLPADVLRTLESIYRRTPFPSDDMVRGVWDLHKLNREAVLQWFIARRADDGIASSTQKRRERPRGGGASVYIRDGDDDGSGRGALGSGAGPRGREEKAGDEANMLMSLMGDAAPGQRGGGDQQPEVKVVHVSRAEMAAIRSSLPSRKKARGRKLAEKLGVKMDEEDENALQIGDTRFITDSPEKAAAQASTRWTQAWRHRRATSAPVSVRRSGGGQEK